MTERNDSEWREVVISSAADVLRAGAITRQFATTLGFSGAQSEELNLVATELATNLVRHASGGRIALCRVRSGQREGIEVYSTDSGPGIADVERALTDGYSTIGGLGVGLGTVNRLMDELEIGPGKQNGTEIVCRRWLHTETPAPVLGRLAFGAATRSCRRLPENGDAFLFKQWGNEALAGVIDGLGHGPFAQRASQTARHYIEQHSDRSIADLFREADRACRATRGVVMALARFDLRAAQLMVASVGNVELRMVGSPVRFHPAVRRGIVGLNAPQAVPSTHPWTRNSLLIMHSDGVRANWDWREFEGLATEPPAVIARTLLSRLGKNDDDATVVVLRSAL